MSYRDVKILLFALSGVSLAGCTLGPYAEGVGYVPDYDYVSQPVYQQPEYHSGMIMTPGQVPSTWSTYGGTGMIMTPGQPPTFISGY